MNLRPLVVVATLVAAVDAPAAHLEASTASAGDLAATVNSVASILREEYVFPELGDRMARDVLDRLNRGEYDAIGDDRGLAERLTADLRAISNDGHLRVIHSPRTGGSAAAIPLRSADDLRRENFYFRKVELLHGNIG